MASEMMLAEEGAPHKMHLSQAAWATVTEHHRLGLKLQTFLPHSSASWKSRIKDLVRTLFLASGQPPSCCILTWQKERLFLLGHQSYGIRDFRSDLTESESPPYRLHL